LPTRAVGSRECARADRLSGRGRHVGSSYGNAGAAMSSGPVAVEHSAVARALTAALMLRQPHRRQHEPQRIVGDLLNAENSEKQARSIKYQLTIAKLPLAKISPTSSSRARRSTRHSSTSFPAETLSHSSAMPCRSAVLMGRCGYHRCPPIQNDSGPPQGPAGTFRSDLSVR
jgi:hypothetical protein